MKVLVIGSGGREHALAWKIRQSSLVTDVVIIPGNAGTAGIGRNVRLKLADLSKIRAFAQEREIGVEGNRKATSAGRYKARWIGGVFQKNCCPPHE